MDDLPEMNKETYIGDGVYVSFDGFYVRLRTPRENGDHWIGIEPHVYSDLRRWLKRYPRLAQHMGELS